MSFLKRLLGLFKAEEQPRKAEKEKIEKTVEKKDKQKEKKIKTAEDRAEQIIADAKERAAAIEKKARQRAKRTREKVDNKKEELDKKEAVIDRKTGALEERVKLAREKESELDKKLKEIDEIKEKQLARLEKAAGLSTQEAKEAKEEIKDRADEEAKEILVNAMRRGATDYVPEYTVSSVQLPDEDLKGRIIGKGGRNIRSFEKITGVDVDLDEEEVITLSSFDPVRREIAKISLEKLIADGRIQPTRIEETVAKTKKEIDRIMHKEGEKLCHKLKVYNLPKQVIDKLGRFKYRFSYGQNMISHTLEESKIGIALAHEVGADVNVVRLGCLLHDIGKVVTDKEGSHVELGVDFLKKFNIPDEVISCVAEHHEDKPFTSLESVLVYIADAISGSRPGARYEDYEGYVERLEGLEDTATSFPGVTKAFAIQAGREVRVIVDPDNLSDDETVKLAHDLSKKIEKEFTYPGQVKVTAIREMRASGIAK
jgi:ribonuclease Y